MGEKILLGLSGGVDSALSACLLLEAGYEVHGLYLDAMGEGERECAIHAAAELGIPLTVRNVTAELEEDVCRPFREAYLRGETPNPCVLCNPAVKMNFLLREADRIGAEKIATGHYVRSENGRLYMGHPDNDQSYMLCRLFPHQARRLVLPLGSYSKKEVRAMAAVRGLTPAKKPDSMEICFIPDQDHARYLELFAGDAIPRGRFLCDGEELGENAGIHRYTVGQRWPGLYRERRLYVKEILPESGDILLCRWEELFTKRFSVRDVRFLSPEETGERKFLCQVRIRHTRWETPNAVFTPDGTGGGIVETETEVRAPAPGQAAAFYRDGELLGGGMIKKDGRS